MSMEKQMKNSSKKYYIIIGVLTASICIFFATFLLYLNKQDAKTTTSETNSEENTTKDEETLAIPTLKPLTYVEEVELDFIEQPKKRTREEAVEKIKELSRWYPSLYFVYKNEAEYPLELLLSGAGNPEMADFLYGYLKPRDNILGEFTEAEQPEDYPLFLQFDPRWGYIPYGSEGTVGSSGCGPACLSMAVFYLTGERSATPGVIAQYSLDHEYYLDRVGTLWSLMVDYPAEHGLSSYQVQLREQNLKAELDKGRILICSVREGDFTSTGHFILIYGYDENGFKINDPKCVYRSRLSWTYQQIYDDIKATWSIGK